LVRLKLMVLKQLNMSYLAKYTQTMGTLAECFTFIVSLSMAKRCCMFSYVTGVCIAYEY